uniref:Extended synaptotagmin-2 n=1 Tax=Panagrellus redivivus TaxID=6233 RepID=A0A7E4V2D6_PANRE
MINNNANNAAYSPAEVIMSWPNYIVPIVSTVVLMTSCWAVGHYDLSFLWIIIFCVLYVLKQHMWMKRENRRLRLRQVIMQEREAVMAQFTKLEDMPAWIQFPDIERIEWVNHVLLQLWPYIAEYSKSFMRELIEPQVRSCMPSPFKSFKFTHIDMGDMPCRVSGLKVYTKNVGRDRIIIDMDVGYAGDAEFTVNTCGFTGGLNQLVLTGRVRCVLMPLLNVPPMIGGVSASFIELPKIDFNLTGMGEFVQLPGLIDAIRSIMNIQMANICVLPNKIVVPLAPNVDVTQLYFPEPDGMVRIKIIEARNLENKDISFLRKDKSDPYCELQVGAQVFRTRTINNDLNPVFNEYFEAVVDQSSGQTLRLELFDADDTGKDEELGRLSLPIEVIRHDGILNKWFHLEGCKHGELHIKVQWFDLSKKKELLEKQIWDNQWITSDKPVHTAILMVYIDTVSDLPYPKANLEPSPFMEASLGQVVQRTAVKTKTVNPLFQTKFTFFVKQPEGQELKLKAIDDGTKRPLGELNISLLSIIDQPDMEVFQATYNLVMGIHQCPIVLTVRMRAFEPTTKQETNNVFESTAKAYGNASHIERAERVEVVVANGDEKGHSGAGDVTAAEPGKTVEYNGGLLTPERKLNTENYQTLNASNGSLAGSTISQHGLMQKLRRSKHTKRSFKNKTEGGELLVDMFYDADEFKLCVNIISARNLRPVEQKGNADPYVKVKLIPTQKNSPKKEKKEHKTGVVSNTLNPQFDNEFSFNVHYSDLRNYKLIFAVKDDLNYGVLHRQPTLGFVEIPLENFDHKNAIKGQWLALHTS